LETIPISGLEPSKPAVERSVFETRRAQLEYRHGSGRLTVRAGPSPSGNFLFQGVRDAWAWRCPLPAAEWLVSSALCFEFPSSCQQSERALGENASSAIDFRVRGEEIFEKITRRQSGKAARKGVGQRQRRSVTYAASFRCSPSGEIRRFLLWHRRRRQYRFWCPCTGATLLMIILFTAIFRAPRPLAHVV